MGVPVVMAVPMAMVVLMYVLMAAAVIVIIADRRTAIRWRLGRPVAVLHPRASDADEIGREPGGKGRDDAGERSDNGQDRVREGICQADGVRPRSPGWR